jgi:hypothetical protein
LPLTPITFTDEGSFSSVEPTRRMLYCTRRIKRGQGQQLTLVIRSGEPLQQIVLKQSVRVAKDDGTFASALQLPLDLPYGTYTMEAIGGPEGKILAVADFFKSYAADEGLGRGR